MNVLGRIFLKFLNSQKYVMTESFVRCSRTYILYKQFFSGIQVIHDTSQLSNRAENLAVNFKG